MSQERKFKETVARCVSIMVCYHNSDESPDAEQVMVQDVRAIVDWVAKEAVGKRKTRSRILRPLTSELVSRYGDDVGGRLSDEFQAVFGLPPARPRVSGRGGDGTTGSHKRVAERTANLSHG
jgi:hypothetical protein